MRAFIAIELPQGIKDALGNIQELLKQVQADVSWVKPENIHLTLKFLGEIDENKSEKIIDILESVCRINNPFRIRLCSLGAFPKIDYPRVIWVSIDKGDDEVKKIANTLEEEIAKIGIPKEDRPFSSHITIGRARSGINRKALAQALKANAAEVSEKNLEFPAAKITLFKSTLSSKGPTYEIIKEAILTT